MAGQTNTGVTIIEALANITAVAKATDIILLKYFDYQLKAHAGLFQSLSVEEKQPSCCLRLITKCTLASNYISQKPERPAYKRSGVTIRRSIKNVRRVSQHILFPRTRRRKYSKGFVRVTGRVKDMIIRDGKNIFPAEIEAVLVEHPKIL